MPGKRARKIRRHAINAAAMVVENQRSSSERMMSEDMLQGKLNALEQSLLGTQASGATVSVDAISGHDDRRQTNDGNCTVSVAKAPRRTQPSAAASMATGIGDATVATAAWGSTT